MDERKCVDDKMVDEAFIGSDNEKDVKIRTTCVVVMKIKMRK